MSIHSSNSYLSLSQMKDNAQYILDYLIARGWTKNAVCGMIGNMQRESTINPGIWQNLDSGNTSLGYGLVQWTPASKYLNWCSERGLEPSSMDSNLKRILWELETGEQYYATDSFPETFSQFIKSTKSVTYLAEAFLMNYERAGVAALDERISNANYWFNNLSVSETSNFIPRTSQDGIEGSYYWYDGNPFYLSGYGLPNCTCYAYGRFWEISDLLDDSSQNYSNKPTGLSLHDAGKWYEESTYDKGSEAKLGAVAVWSDNDGGAGHVAIVEAIAANGDITISQSAYGGSYFYVNTKSKAEGYNYSGKTFLGFIYNPFVTSGGGDIPDIPDVPIVIGKYIPSKKKKGFKFNIYV